MWEDKESSLISGVLCFQRSMDSDVGLVSPVWVAFAEKGEMRKATDRVVSTPILLQRKFATRSLYRPQTFACGRSMLDDWVGFENSLFIGKSCQTTFKCCVIFNTFYH